MYFNVKTEFCFAAYTETAAFRSVSLQTKSKAEILFNLVGFTYA